MEHTVTFYITDADAAEVRSFAETVHQDAVWQFDQISYDIKENQ